MYSDIGMEEMKVFIQPVMGNAAGGTWKEQTLLGEKDLSRYYCFSPAALPEKGYLIYDGVSYDVLKSEKFCAFGRISHWESILGKRAPEHA